jgi:hypothetical protein
VIGFLQLSLGNQNDELVLEVLGLAHRYGFHDLQVAVSDYLEAMLSIKNVCMVRILHLSHLIFWYSEDSNLIVAFIARCMTRHLFIPWWI